MKKNDYKSGTLRIAVVGDVALMHRPGQSLYRSTWDAADIRIANLEGPIITEPGLPAEKLIRLRLPAEAADWLQDLGTTAVSLANNHMLDWGVVGLNSTLKELDRVGIMHAGAGQNAKDAAKPALIEVGGLKIAFLSWASTIPMGFQATNRRAGIAGVRIRSSFIIDPTIDEQPGSPPWVCTEPIEEDLGRLEDSVREASAIADFVILALHWGVPPQYGTAFQGPVAEYQSVLAERAAAAGAGVIVGHHCHAPYGVGTAGSVPVLYSLGNYIFHPDHVPGGLDISPAAVPYPEEMPLLAENNQSCVVEIELTSDTAKGPRVTRLSMHPALLNELGEAITVTEAEAQPIAERLWRFSKAHGTHTRIDQATVIWEPSQLG